MSSNYAKPGRRRHFSIASPGRRRGSYWGRWLQRRLPAADEVKLDRSNLFILPTREGVLFLALLAIMLLTGINYQNSLIYLLTFLLGALYYVGILQTHGNLSGISLSLRKLEEGFAGGALAVDLQLNLPDELARTAIDLVLDDSIVHIDARHNGQVASLAYVPPSRGYHTLPRVRIETRYPLGLFKAWTYLWLKSNILAYPQPVQPPDHTRQGRLSSGAQSQVRQQDGVADDFILRPYRTGDSPQRVQWKRFARNAQMVVLEPEARVSDSLWLDYDAFPDTPVELRLSYLSWLVEESRQQGLQFGLRLPGSILKPDSGMHQAQRAQRCLALFKGGHG